MTPNISNQEILDLCDSIKDIQRALHALGQLFNDVEKNPPPENNGAHKDFQRWGLHKITHMFLLDQYQKLNRIREIYLDAEKTMS